MSIKPIKMLKKQIMQVYLISKLIFKEVTWYNFVERASVFGGMSNLSANLRKKERSK